MDYCKEMSFRDKAKTLLTCARVLRDNRMDWTAEQLQEGADAILELLDMYSKLQNQHEAGTKKNEQRE